MQRALGDLADATDAIAYAPEHPSSQRDAQAKPGMLLDIARRLGVSLGEEVHADGIRCATSRRRAPPGWQARAWCAPATAAKTEKETGPQRKDVAVYDDLATFARR